MEDLDPTDRDFFPCPCDYQVCLWCVAHIQQKLGGKCPACRQPYSESKYRYIRPTSVNQNPQPRPTPEKKTSCYHTTNAVERGLPSTSRKQHQSLAKVHQPSAVPMLTTTAAGNQAHLRNVRVIQRNLVYVLGLPTSLARVEDLKSLTYFGRYGTITNFVVCKNQAPGACTAGTTPLSSYSAYITYQFEQDAVDCIRDVDGCLFENRNLRAAFGTTKYCSFFLRGLKCTKQDCFYLHALGAEEDSFTKDEMVASRNIFYGIPASLKCDDEQHNALDKREPTCNINERTASRRPSISKEPHNQAKAISQRGTKRNMPHRYITLYRLQQQSPSEADENQQKNDDAAREVFPATEPVRKVTKSTISAPLSATPATDVASSPSNEEGMVPSADPTHDSHRTVRNSFFGTPVPLSLVTALAKGTPAKSGTNRAKRDRRPVSASRGREQSPARQNLVSTKAKETLFVEPAAGDDTVQTKLAQAPVPLKKDTKPMKNALCLNQASDIRDMTSADVVQLPHTSTAKTVVASSETHCQRPEAYRPSRGVNVWKRGRTTVLRTVLGRDTPETPNESHLPDAQLFTSKEKNESNAIAATVDKGACETFSKPGLQGLISSALTEQPLNVSKSIQDSNVRCSVEDNRAPSPHPPAPITGRTSESKAPSTGEPPTGLVPCLRSEELQSGSSLTPMNETSAAISSTGTTRAHQEVLPNNGASDVAAHPIQILPGSIQSSSSADVGGFSLSNNTNSVSYSMLSEHLDAYPSWDTFPQISELNSCFKHSEAHSRRQSAHPNNYRYPTSPHHNVVNNDIFSRPSQNLWNGAIGNPIFDETANFNHYHKKLPSSTDSLAHSQFARKSHPSSIGGHDEHENSTLSHSAHTQTTLTASKDDVLLPYNHRVRLEKLSFCRRNKYGEIERHLAAEHLFGARLAMRSDASDASDASDPHVILPNRMAPPVLPSRQHFPYYPLQRVECPTSSENSSTQPSGAFNVSRRQYATPPYISDLSNEHLFRNTGSPSAANLSMLRPMSFYQQVTTLNETQGRISPHPSASSPQHQRSGLDVLRSVLPNANIKVETQSGSHVTLACSNRSASNSFSHIHNANH